MPRCFYVFYKKQRYIVDIGVIFEVKKAPVADKSVPCYQLGEIPAELQQVLLEKFETIN